ncbi:unnamed protein product [Brassica oleracea]|uniref:(rape) hypothetical protein n=1 Tax=Brassica napus TaxID=3708 RepID=A0A816Q5Q4_BRANA|nr:unnamed protein product [Brassica napus]
MEDESRRWFSSMSEPRWLSSRKNLGYSPRLIISVALLVESRWLPSTNLGGYPRRITCLILETTEKKTSRKEEIKDYTLTFGRGTFGMFVLVLGDNLVDSWYRSRILGHVVCGAQRLDGLSSWNLEARWTFVQEPEGCRVNPFIKPGGFRMFFDSEVGAVSNESVERSSLLDQIELEFEGMLRSQSLFLIVIVFMLISMVNQAGSDGVKAESKDGEDLYLLGDRRSCWKTWLPKTYCKGGLGTSRCLRRRWECSRGLEEARYEEAVLVEMEPNKKKKKRKREKTDIRKTKKMEEDDGNDRTRDGRKAAATKKRKFDDGAQSSTSHATESKTSEADEGTNRPRVLRHLRHVVGQSTYAESFQFGHKTEQASCSCSDDGVRVAKDEKASALRRCHLHTCSAFSLSLFQYMFWSNSKSQIGEN